MLQKNLLPLLCILGLFIIPMEMFGNMPKPPMPMPEPIAAAEKEAEQMKDVADENDMTDEQFYRCFSQVNCELGPEAKKDVFDCYTTPNEEEQKEYASWFKECPVGEFTEYDIYKINKVFCTMNEKDQRTLNEFFLEKGTFNVKDICGKPANKQKCMRIKDSAKCISELLEKYVANGKCDTFVQEVPMNPMAQ